MRHARTHWSIRHVLPCWFALLGADALASQFVGNHLFVSDPGNQVIRELDANGAIVRLLGGSTLVLPQRSTVGPDGNLYVLDDHGGFSSTDHLVVLSPDGDLVADLPLTGLGSFDAADAPEPYFAPDGKLLLIDNATGAVRIVDPATGTLVGSYTDASITGLGGVRVTARGRIVVATTASSASLAAFEPDGSFAGELASPSLGTGVDSPLLIDGPNGTSFVLLRSTATPATAELHALATDGASMAELALTDGPYLDMRIGPDGRIWLLGENGATLYKVNSALDSAPVQVAFLPAPGQATGFAFAPFRIRLKASGSEVFAGQGADSVPSTGYVVSYFPGADRLAFSLTTGGDAAQFLGTDRPTFHGSEAYDDAASNRRLQVTFSSERAGASLGAAAFLKIKGTVNSTTGYFKPKSASGTLDIASTVGQFHAELTFVKVIE